jgi:hypothetical protein
MMSDEHLSHGQTTHSARQETAQPSLAMLGPCNFPPPPEARALDTFARCAGFNVSRPFRRGGGESDEAKNTEVFRLSKRRRFGYGYLL